MKYLFFIIFCLTVFSQVTWSQTITHTGNSEFIQSVPVDMHATKETINLYNNLGKLADKGIMFGHQDALAYGVKWKYVPGKSDVKELVGDYPAVYGWELGNLEHDSLTNLDSVPFDKMKGFIREAYERGGVNTISWHNDNPVNLESSWDTTHGGVASILPGGTRHEMYKTWLDRLAIFMLDLKGKNGELIPVLFRPYHELTGSWFWWGRNFCTPTEYKLLWRFTVDYLRNVKQVHNLLYVYNTSDFSSKDIFLERYPGDDVVDMISFDSYQHGNPLTDSSYYKKVNYCLTVLEEVAKEKNKLAAFAETGYEKTPYKNWWTETLGKLLAGRKISFVLVWRNAGLMPNGNMHYYVPQKEDVSADDFKKFYKQENILFEKEVAKEKLYQ